MFVVCVTSMDSCAARFRVPEVSNRVGNSFDGITKLRRSSSCQRGFLFLDLFEWARYNDFEMNETLHKRTSLLPIACTNISIVDRSSRLRGKRNKKKKKREKTAGQVLNEEIRSKPVGPAGLFYKIKVKEKGSGIGRCYSTSLSMCVFIRN